ncbi:MAG: ribosome-recycling factor, partial [bacterium]|nr:ribosome-recycling factor [bacterium]
TLRVFVPPLSEERRREIVKHLHRMAEEIKVSVRNHRRDANDNIKNLEKNGEVNKDDAKKYLDKIQKQTDARIADTDILLKEKEEECMAV